MKDSIRTFYQFMQFYDSWRSFKMECRSQKKFKGRKDFSIGYCAAWISVAFDWKHSKEGYDYWHRINKKWNHQISGKINCFR